MAEREAKLQKEYADEKAKAIAETIKQMDEQRKREMKELKDHYEEVMESRMGEQQKLILEGFNEQAKKLHDEIKRLSRSSLQIFKEDYYEPFVKAIRAAFEKEDDRKNKESK